eukprot:sb/3470567/
MDRRLTIKNRNQERTLSISFLNSEIMSVLRFRSVVDSKSRMKDDENINSWFDVEREFGHAYVMTGKFGQGILSEFVGTYLVALVGLFCAIRHGSGDSDLGVLEVALGFSIPYIIYGRMVEGKGTSNLNPALSLTSLFLGYSSVVYCFASFMAQIAGFCFAVATLSLAFDNLQFTLTLRPEGIFDHMLLNLTTITVSLFIHGD